MFLNFTAALATLGGNEGVFRVANESRPPARYLLNSILPEQNRPTYHVDSGSMTVRATMPGMVGMDSPYPPGGIVEVSSFLEQSAKFANEVALSEQTLRHLQDFMIRLSAGGGGGSPEALAQEALNFLQKVVVQPHFDLMEWLRGQAITYGKIDWTFNKKRLLVDYGVPAGNFLTPRTGNDGYGGSASKFWTDIQLLRRKLKNDVLVILAHVDTIEMARYNSVNSMAVVAEGDGAVTFRRVVNNGANVTVDAAADTVRLVGYKDEAEIINPANPETTIVVPFIERGKLVAIGNNVNDGYVVGGGSTIDVDEQVNRLGYTHIAPTVEGGGRAGRWANLYTPEQTPWALHGRGVTNGIPVVEAPTKLAVATTDMV